MFRNLREFGSIYDMEILTNGLKITTEKKVIYIVTESIGDKLFEVQLPNGSYNAQFVYVEANCEQDALDMAVDFLTDWDIAFDHCDFYEAKENDMVDENGEVMDSICCGNEGVYVPCTVVINREEAITMKPIKITTRWNEELEFIFQVNRYANGNNLAIEVLSWNEECKFWEPYSTLTINLPGMHNEPREAFIDTNNGDPNIIKALEKLGYIKNTGIVRNSGYCIYPLYEFSKEFLNIEWEMEREEN